MSLTADLCRLERIIARLTGEKALLDEAKKLIRRSIASQETEASSTEWWATYGPKKPVSNRPRQLIDLVVANGEASPEEIATALDITEGNARKLVHRASNQLLFNDGGGKVTIGFDGSGIARTASTSIVVSSFSPPVDRTRLS